MTSEILSCVFFDGVPCSFRKTKKSAVMTSCLKCSHYVRFLREMDEEDAKVMEEVERIQEFGYPKSFKELKEGAV